MASILFPPKSVTLGSCTVTLSHLCDNADGNYDRYLILVENWIDDSFKEFNMILPYTIKKLIYNDNAKSTYEW